MTELQRTECTAVPRNSIESFRHASIDVSLKDLKAASRRVTGFSAPYHNELQFLERIYYKGKNQHRSALFWRKVLEVRRFGTRIREMNFSRFVEDLHYAFYEAEDRNNPKALRGAWKQAPNSSSCVSLLRRLRSASLLVDQTRARFRAAHGAFTQQLQTATFIPLVMSLISITSRLDFLASELREILVLLWHAVARILDTVADTNTNKYHDVSLPLDPLVSSTVMVPSRAAAARTERAHERNRVSAEITEDFGRRVSRDSHAVTSGSRTPKESSSVTEQLIQDDPNEFAEKPCHSPPNSVVSLSTLPGMPCQTPEVAVVSSHVDILPLPDPLPFRKSPGEFEGPNSVQVEVGKKRKVKKVKKKRNPDEIDDIFGF